MGRFPGISGRESGFRVDADLGQEVLLFGV